MTTSVTTTTQDLMLKSIKGEFINAAEVKCVLAKAAPFFIDLQKHEEGIVEMHQSVMWQRKRKAKQLENGSAPSKPKAKAKGKGKK